MKPSSNPLNTHDNIYGFVIEAKEFEVENAYQSECGRFEVDPVECWGISIDDANKLHDANKAVVEATEAALNAGALAVQTALNISDGYNASVFFTNAELKEQLSKVFRDYMAYELAIKDSESPPSEANQRRTDADR